MDDDRTRATIGGRVGSVSARSDGVGNRVWIATADDLQGSLDDAESDLRKLQRAGAPVQVEGAGTEARFFVLDLEREPTRLRVLLREGAGEPERPDPET